MNLLKKALLGLLSGLIIGAVILGIGGRIVMSVIALLGDVTPTWSLDGSIDVIVFGTLAGALIGVIYALAASHLPGSPPVKGLLTGLLLIGGMALLPPPSAQSAMAGFDNLDLPVLLLFGVVCVAFGAALAVAIDVVGKRWPHPTSSE